MSSQDNPKIKTAFIIEILGRPPEHIVDSLKQLIERMEKENGTKIISNKIHEPKKLEDEESLFTSFAEIEAEFEDLSSMFNIVFNYMPSHFEIISPEEFRLKNNDFSGIVTAIMLRLHKYDEVAKKISMDNQILINRMNAITGRTVVSEVKENIPEKTSHKTKKGKKK